MKTLTIRLDKFDLAKIKILQEAGYGNTINGTLRHALNMSITHHELKKNLSDLFVSSWTIDQKKFEEMNITFGLVKGRSGL